MQLDRTYIGIRQRSAMEVWDLTLLVTREHFKPLFFLLLVGVVPWVVINHLMTMWMVSDDFYFDHVGWYYWINACLVTIEAQIGTFLMTHYLGQAMFSPSPEPKQSIRAAREMKSKFHFGRLHLLNRFVIPALALVGLLLTIDDVDAIGVLGGFVLTLFAFLALLIRGRTPYLTEILLLEEAPRKSKSSKVQTYKSRSQNLLAAPGADFFVKFFLAAMVGTVLTLAIYESLCLLDGIMGLQSIANSNLNYIYWPISLWLVAGLIAVNRFLSYIDLRIRTEGWAVRLRLMAEERRIAKV